jgi:hypothetical protein
VTFRDPFTSAFVTFTFIADVFVNHNLDCNQYLDLSQGKITLIVVKIYLDCSQDLP